MRSSPASAESVANVSSSMRLWIWIAKSTPSPIRIGSPEIVTIVSGMPTKPISPNAETQPTSTAGSESSRQRARKTTNSTATMIATAKIAISTSALRILSLISLISSGGPETSAVTPSNW